jgi:hypothetical protein
MSERFVTAPPATPTRVGVAVAEPAAARALSSDPDLDRNPATSPRPRRIGDLPSVRTCARACALAPPVSKYSKIKVDRRRSITDEHRRGFGDAELLPFVCLISTSYERRQQNPHPGARIRFGCCTIHRDTPESIRPPGFQTAEDGPAPKVRGTTCAEQVTALSKLPAQAARRARPARRRRSGPIRPSACRRATRVGNRCSRPETAPPR